MLRERTAPTDSLKCGSKPAPAVLQQSPGSPKFDEGYVRRYVHRRNHEAKDVLRSFDWNALSVTEQRGASVRRLRSGVHDKRFDGVRRKT